MKKINAIKGATYRRSAPKKDPTWNPIRAFAQSNLNDPTYGSRKPRVKTLEKPAAKATVIPHAKPAIKSTLSKAQRTDVVRLRRIQLGISCEHSLNPT